MKEPGIDSYDVFDTTVSRSYALPEDVYWHLGELLTKCKLVETAGQFFGARQEAESKAWQEGNYRKGISISQIYRILAGKLNWTDAERDQAMNEEVRLEIDAAKSVPDTAAAIRASRKQGQKVCFISDMHLNSGHIASMLSRHDAIMPGDQIFVSSDTGETKRSGRLFKHVRGSLSARPEDLRHTGDHSLADFKIPKRQGMNARLYTRARLSRYEACILQQAKPEDWRLRSLAAVSKFTRLECPQSDVDVEIHELLASTIAPFVTGYALWLLARASALGIRKLFFMARDMQIVHEMAARLAKATGQNVECIYIHASRKGWQAPSYSGARAFELSWLLDHLHPDTMEALVRRLLSEDEVEEIKTRREFNLSRTAHDTKTLVELLQAEPVSSLIREESGRRRHLLLAYLHQRGFCPDGSCALVDAGWRGTMQKCLARAYLVEGKTPEITGFYIGLAHPTAPEEGSRLEAFLAKETAEKYGYSLCALLEAFLTANHGSTLGYQPGANGFEPVMSAGPTGIMLKQWNLVRNCCLGYVTHLLDSAASLADAETISHVLAQPFMTLFATPTTKDARLLSRWMFDSGRDETRLVRLAAPLDSINLLKLFVYRARKTGLTDIYLSSPWLQGCIQASAAPARLLAKRLVTMI
jgi:predicted HAD superfamily hydrolase